jgi:hypothetical protein
MLSGNSVILFSPWFTRQGDYGTFTLEVTAQGGTSPVLTVKLFHKNSDDVGDGADVDSVTPTKITGNTVGRFPQTWPVMTASSPTKGLKTMVRYQYTLSGTGTCFATFRMLAPVWFDNVTGY